MRVRPGESAQVAAPLRPSDIVTAYGRTRDSRWILAWNRQITFGWIPSSALGCSAPFEDLRPTDPGILLTPQPTAERTALPTPVASTPTVTATSVDATATVTALPISAETPAPTATATPVMQPTAAITETAEPTPLAATPTTAAEETPAPPEALPCVVISTVNLNVRSGPARTARLIGRLPPGAKFSATGRNSGDETWLYGVTERGTFGWVIGSAVRCEGDIRALPVATQGGYRTEASR